MYVEKRKNPQHAFSRLFLGQRSGKLKKRLEVINLPKDMCIHLV